MTNNLVELVDHFDLLGNRRRLLVIGYLSLVDQQASVEVRDLARVIRSIELETPPHQIKSKEYESAYNGLIQTHLPKLAANGVIEYDDSRKTLSPTYRIYQYSLLVHFVLYFTQV
ncbi:DUF7344 domain-containing protein [Natrialba hulunbeirensis]